MKTEVSISIQDHSFILSLDEAKELRDALTAEISKWGSSFAMTKAYSGSLTAQEIKSVIRLRGMRPADLAKHFGVTKEGVSAIVAAPDSGLVIAERGWVKAA